MRAKVGWRAALVLTIFGVVVGCGGDDPEAAFDRLHAALAAGDPSVLYDALDTDSRWAVDSTWGYHREIATAAATMPEGARAKLMARVGLAAQAPTAAAWFGARAAELAPLALLGGSVAGLGTRTKLAVDGARATVTTSTGLAVPFVKGPDGKWGWSGLAERLAGEKGSAANDAARVKEDVERLAR